MCLDIHRILRITDDIVCPSQKERKREGKERGRERRIEDGDREVRR